MALFRTRFEATRRAWLGAMGGLAASVLSPGVHSQSRYPTRPLRLVVPFPAGTSPDVMARLWGERFAKAVGQPVVVENKAGAATIIAAQAVAAAPADGYTLFWTVNNTFSINPFVYRKLPYIQDDFVPVTRVLNAPFVLLVSSESPYRSLDDMIQAARKDPGKLTYASPGIGTSPHVVMARMLNAAGVTMTHVPYKDYFMPDVMARRVDAAFDATTTAIGQLKGGKVRALGVASPTRLEQLKDVAPIAESLPGFAGGGWQGVFVRKGTPEAIVTTIVEHSNAIVRSAEFRDTLAGYGLMPVGSTSQEFREFLDEDARGWEQVIRANNISVE
jgi:tripartite-type tricarboxylate transporter receptor subunit TctC